MSGTVFGACPTPLLQYRQIVLGHGSGGRLTHELIKDVFAPPGPLEDQATLPFAAGRLAVTTDSFVVKPIFFPGGDIGKLAITGSVNDLAVGGARPRFIAAAFILEEGLPLDDLRRIVASMRAACGEGEVQLVTGDTKVVDRGKGDQVFISTTAIGEVPEGVSLSIAAARPGDRLLVSGTVGDHGIAILSVREGIELDTPLLSDCAPLTGLAQALLAAAPGVRRARGPTTRTTGWSAARRRRTLRSRAPETRSPCRSARGSDESARACRIRRRSSRETESGCGRRARAPARPRRA